MEFVEVLNEENNYLILKFNNSVDWLQAQTLAQLKEAKNYSTRKDGEIKKGMERRGLNRVVDGVDFINKLIGEK